MSRPPASMAEPLTTAPRSDVTAARRGARSVPTGSALTTSAPAIGGRPHTTTRRSTPRKRAPTRAPNVSASAVSATIAPRGRRRCSSVRRRGRAAAHRDRGDRRHQRDRRLDEEHRPPVDSWVTAPPSTGPSAAPATPAAAHQRAARRESPSRVTSTPSEPATSAAPPDALRDAGGDESGERRGEPGGERRRGEHGRAGEGERRAADAAQQHQPGEAGHGHGECVAGEHPRDGGDRRPEFDVEVGDREGDDRGVGERQRDCRRKHDRGDRPRAAANGRRCGASDVGDGGDQFVVMFIAIRGFDVRSLTAVP